MEIFIGLLVSAVLYWLVMAEHRRKEKQNKERQLAKELVLRLHEANKLTSAESLEILARFSDNPISPAGAERRWEAKMRMFREKAESRRNSECGNKL